MNYRHDYHAGNFADVFKHIFLTRVLLHLAAKPAPFRYIETHSGSGIYDLSAEAAEKTAEWRDGIGRLKRAELLPGALEVIEPYLNIIEPMIHSSRPRYKGSPAIASALVRPQDKMLFCELHPEARQKLKDNLGRNPHAKVIEIDGYTGLNAFIPPVERRGLVLIDPPFEQPDEFARLAAATGKAWRKWPAGLYMIWYPVKDEAAADRFIEALARQEIQRILRIELQVAAPSHRGPLARTGLAFINPPYRLEAEARQILPCLAQILAQGRADFLIEGICAG